MDDAVLPWLLTTIPKLPFDVVPMVPHCLVLRTSQLSLIAFVTVCLFLVLPLPPNFLQWYVLLYLTISSNNLVKTFHLYYSITTSTLLAFWHAILS